jgi:hypothetical protein
VHLKLTQCQVVGDYTNHGQASVSFPTHRNPERQFEMMKVISMLYFYKK